MRNRLLIVGIDPGTNTGLAILDSKGRLIKLKAKEGFSKADIIREIFELGEPLIIATDRESCPSFIKEVGAKFNCKVHEPEEDLSERKKANLATKYSGRISNKHEEDALAAALNAYKQSKKLFRRIKNKFDKEKNIKEAKKNIILGKAKNIEEALDE